MIVLFASIVPVIYRDTLNPGTAGLALTYASGVTTTLNLLVAMISRVETNMVNVERAKEYQDGIPKERFPSSECTQKEEITQQIAS